MPIWKIQEEEEEEEEELERIIIAAASRLPFRRFSVVLTAKESRCCRSRSHFGSV